MLGFPAENPTSFGLTLSSLPFSCSGGSLCSKEEATIKYLCWTVRATCILSLVVLSGCTSPRAAISPAQLDSSQNQATIQALQKRLHDRERIIAIQDYQIEVMSSQLDALKRIDQDFQDQRQSLRRSVTVTP